MRGRALHGPTIFSWPPQPVSCYSFGHMKRAGTGSALFDFCDLTCEYAEIPKETGIDGSGSCRTFIALYCKRKKTLVHKNHPCSKKIPKQKHTASG